MSINDDEMLCPECDQEMEQIVKTGPFGRPQWRWFCSCCGCEYDDDGELVEKSHQFDDDFELANFCRGGDLTED